MLAWNGLAKYDGKDFTYYTTENGLPANSIMTLCIDSENNIWVGTFDLGAAKFDGENWTYFNSDNSPLLKIVQDIIQDKNGNYWFATSNNIQDGIVCNEPLVRREETQMFCSSCIVLEELIEPESKECGFGEF